MTFLTIEEMNILPQLKTGYFQKLSLVIVFLVFAPITLVLSSFSLMTLNKNTKSIKNVVPKENLASTHILSSADSEEYPSMSSNIVSGDARPQILKNFLHDQKSELEPYSDLLVQKADEYNLDYRLLVAIATKESGACRVIPPDSHNCWGWGIHSKGTLMFDNYPEAIDAVSKGLKENYIDKGYVTPDQIMTKYAHKDSTTWGPDVSIYMSELE